MHEEEAPYQLGWGAGWAAAVDKMRVLLTAELSDQEALLRSNREDGFDEEDPLVFLHVDHIKSLRKLARDMDIFLPGRPTGA